MWLLTLVLAIISAYYARKEYKNYRIGAAMFWASLLGWNIHSLITKL